VSGPRQPRATYWEVRDKFFLRIGYVNWIERFGPKSHADGTPIPLARYRKTPDEHIAESLAALEKSRPKMELPNYLDARARYEGWARLWAHLSRRAGEPRDPAAYKARARRDRLARRFARRWGVKLPPGESPTWEAVHRALMAAGTWVSDDPLDRLAWETFQGLSGSST
jgi:hypothetical protein